MDEELRAYLDARFGTVDSRLDAVNSRLDAVNSRLDAVNSRLDAQDRRLDAQDRRLDAMDGRIEAMEGRLMARINDGQERMLERMRGLEASVSALTEIARSTNTLLNLLVNSQADLIGRVTRLERGDKS